MVNAPGLGSGGAVRKRLLAGSSPALHLAGGGTKKDLFTPLLPYRNQKANADGTTWNEQVVGSMPTGATRSSVG